MDEATRQGHIDAVKGMFGATGQTVNAKRRRRADPNHSELIRVSMEQARSRRIKPKSLTKRERCSVAQLNKLLPKGKNSLDPKKLKRTV